MGVRIPNSRGHAKAWEREKERRKKNALCNHRSLPLKVLGLHLGAGEEL